MSMFLLRRSCLSVLLFLPGVAHASIGCFVETSDAGAITVKLYEMPDTSSHVLREVPLGDAVHYLDLETAPEGPEGWAWVGHDITQKAMWPAGIQGWMKLENMSC